MGAAWTAAEGDLRPAFLAAVDTARRPDPAFTDGLRAGLARALDLPKGATVPDLHPQRPAAAETALLTPYLAVRDARAAINWYGKAFGARLHGEPVVMPDGRIGHAELRLGDAPLMLAEQHPEIGVAAPTTEAGAAVTLHLEVADVDATLHRAVAAGARLERPAAGYEHGRNGVVRDPFGHRWLVAAGAVPAPRHGDLGYASLWVPDLGHATAFFAAVLGWRYGPASGAAGRQIQGQSLHHGLWGGIAPPTLFCCYAVDDVEAAAARVAAAGGTAGAVRPEPFGPVAECTDDQGARFAVYQPPGGVGTGTPGAANGTRPGDLAYVTVEVIDATRARAFYGRVLGWRFTPGSVPDGWQVDGVVPMTGLSGGHQRPTTVPMYRVADVRAAVDAVQAAGGTTTDPEPQPYGITASCTDDQRTRFFLGQLPT